MRLINYMLCVPKSAIGSIKPIQYSTNLKFNTLNLEY